MNQLQSIQNNHVVLENIEKQFSKREVLKGINLKVKQGEFVSIVGKSGCGKSTLLRLIAGLDKLTKGNIFITEQQLIGLNKEARIMFQDGRLLPWKRVIDNVCVGLEKADRKKGLRALQQVGLSDRESDWPNNLSGGQKQRVALARALVHNPKLLLLDEPLGALDALTRIEMQQLIEGLWREKRFTALLVTHDVEEAVAMSDRVLLLENGIVTLNTQIDLPRPRQRSNHTFSMYVETIVNQLLGTNPYKGKPNDIVQSIGI
ncbi:ATP-binding cassette domain-containing protein [Virgibacillus soli]|uniref:ATP-binding cassette domain-containing protein n=1 Tax=Paracerasibacillus soli TaxID=480284 RepID=UPI0035E83A8B